MNRMKSTYPVQSCFFGRNQRGHNKRERSPWFNNSFLRVDEEAEQTTTTTAAFVRSFPRAGALTVALTDALTDALTKLLDSTLPFPFAQDQLRALK